MKKIVRLVFITSSVLYASDIVYDGNLRAGFQYQDEGEFAVGGNIHAKSQVRDYLSVGASFYTTQGIDKKYNDGISFFSSSKHSYSILGEAYIKAELSNTELTIGRQELDTPYADTDDIGMIANTFEAVTLLNSNFTDTTIFAGYLKKMSGVDSEKPEKFNDIGDVYSVGVTYEGFEDTVLSAWYYDVGDLAKMSYIEAGYEKKFADLNIDFDFQYSNQDFDHGGDVDIYGASLAVGKGGVILSIAYDKADSTDGQIADNFFGGGPFFINCEHITMADIGADSDAYRIGFEVNGTSYGVDGFSTGFSYFEGEHLEEIDIVASYELDDRLSFDLIYSDTTNNVDDSESFTNTRFFANYKF